MTDAPQTRATVAWQIWVAIRFIVFGVGGFIALWISWLSLIFANDPPSDGSALMWRRRSTSLVRS